jgi:hypothetical protein
MIKRIFTAAVFSGVMAVVASTAFAQAPPMDMSWGMQVHPTPAAQALKISKDAATWMAYYRYAMVAHLMQQSGDTKAIGATPEALREQLERLLDAVETSKHTDSAFEGYGKRDPILEYDYRAILGCKRVTDADGSVRWTCPELPVQK